jgi:hypothetical protein
MADIASADSGRNINLRHPLEIFRERSSQLADRVRRRELSFIDSIDMAYSAADFAGLVEHYGDDQIQEILAAAFMDERRPS